jgi:predicted nucleic acid-binding protein
VTPVAFLDANVLYSATTRSVLMYLAIRGMFRARWSASVQDEWIAALSKDRPDLDPQRLARTRQLMDTRILDAVVSDYEHLIASISLPDADDRHVLAAAIHGGASVIVTANVKDFPTAALAPYRISGPGAGRLHPRPPRG